MEPHPTKEPAMSRDIHSPANIRPEHYEYLDTVYFGPEVIDLIGFDATPDGASGRELEGYLSDSPYIGNFRTKGTCDHCGARFLYGALFGHTESADVLVVGHQCADHVFGSSNRRELDLKRAKDHVRLARLKTALGKQVASFLGMHEGLETALTVNHPIAHNLRGSLTRYGNLSDKQVELAFEIARQVAAASVEEVEVFADVVEGVREVEGRVLTTKVQDSFYGLQVKMLLLTVDNEKLWSTCPQALLDQGVKRGDIVKFTGKVEASKGDPKFGFVSRPRKATMVLTNGAPTIQRLLDEGVPESLHAPLTALKSSRSGAAEGALANALRALPAGSLTDTLDLVLWRLAGHG
jgi:hypothetical protein